MVIFDAHPNENQKYHANTASRKISAGERQSSGWGRDCQDRFLDKATDLEFCQFSKLACISDAIRLLDDKQQRTVPLSVALKKPKRSTALYQA